MIAVFCENYKWNLSQMDHDLHLPFESGHSKTDILHLVISNISWFNANCVELDQTAPLSRSTYLSLVTDQWSSR